MSGYITEDIFREAIAILAAQEVPTKNRMIWIPGIGALPVEDPRAQTYLELHEE